MGRAFYPIGRPWPALAVAAALAVSGCKTVGLQGGGAQATGTNAPVAAFENMKPGSEEDFILSVGRKTFFAEGSAELDETARVTLDRQAAWLLRYPEWYIKLQGFSDDPGSEKANATLSKQRAEAVMSYLASRGIDRRRMWSRGYGRERIVRDCADIQCKSQNRRVVSNLRNERET